MSQAGPSGSAPTTSPPSWLSPVEHGRLLYFLFTVLNVGLILLVYYYLWRLFFSRSDRLNEPATVATAPSSPSAGSPSASTRIAASLHSETLSALPVFDYASTGAGDEKLECAVCLSEFRDGDKGRLLPRCGHRFHVDCVDTWFQSHSTCPICRSTVEPKASSGSDEAV